MGETEVCGSERGLVTLARADWGWGAERGGKGED